MKKTLIASAAALALAAAAAIAPAAVSAADTTTGPATGSTIAEFKVNPGDGTTPPTGDHGTGDNANLWLVKAPDLLFEDATVGQLIAGDTLPFKSGETGKKTTDAAENQTRDLAITDNRGSGAGWTLTASVGEPTDTKTNLTGTLNLGFTGATSAVPGTAAPQVAALSTDGTAATVWAAAAQTGQGANTAKVDAATTSFKINGDPTVTAGTYDATVTWTLGSTVTPN